jgi:acyl-CoA thioester hydrolase
VNGPLASGVDMNQLPIIALRGEVKPEWIDLNGHMQSLAYVDVLHHATGPLFHSLGIGIPYIETRRLSVFQREFHISYERELKLGDPIEVRSWLIGADAKRIHHFHELWQSGLGYRAATIEYMSLHIDLANRRTAPFPPDVAERLAALAEGYARLETPPGASARISLDRTSRG